MRPQFHFLSSVLLIFAALKVYPDLGMNALWLFIGSFGIDFDYYLFYIYVTGDYNLGRMLKHYEKHRTDTGQIRIFHTAEFLILMTVGSFYFKFIKLTLVGMVLHILLDLLDLIIMRRNYRRRYFFITNWIREKFIIKR